MIQAMIFYVLAASAVVLAVLVVAARNPVYSALSLIGCMFALAGIFAFHSAHLMAGLQILVYAGAIMVLILFVIMLLNLSPEELGGPKILPRKVTGAYLLGAVGTLMIVHLAGHLRGPAPEVSEAFGTVEKVGKVLFTDFLLPFEMVSLLLLAAIIGAIILARKLKGDGP